MIALLLSSATASPLADLSLPAVSESRTTSGVHRSVRLPDGRMLYSPVHSGVWLPTNGVRDAEVRPLQLQLTGSLPVQDSPWGWVVDDEALQAELRPLAPVHEVWRGTWFWAESEGRLPCTNSSADIGPAGLTETAKIPAGWLLLDGETRACRVWSEGDAFEIDHCQSTNASPPSGTLVLFDFARDPNPGCLAPADGRFATRIELEPRVVPGLAAVPPWAPPAGGATVLGIATAWVLRRRRQTNIEATHPVPEEEAPTPLPDDETMPDTPVAEAWWDPDTEPPPAPAEAMRHPGEASAHDRTNELHRIAGVLLSLHDVAPSFAELPEPLRSETRPSQELWVRLLEDCNALHGAPPSTQQRTHALAQLGNGDGETLRQAVIVDVLTPWLLAAQLASEAWRYERPQSAVSIDAHTRFARWCSALNFHYEPVPLYRHELREFAHRRLEIQRSQRSAEELLGTKAPEIATDGLVVRVPWPILTPAVRDRRAELIGLLLPPPGT